MLAEKLQTQQPVLIEAKNLDDYKKNLETRYGTANRINKSYSAKFDSKLNQIGKQFTKGLGEFIDPILLLHEMHYNWKYSCADINETLKEFNIFWDQRGMKEQLTHFLGWSVNDGPIIRRASKNSQLKKERKEEKRSLFLEQREARKLKSQEKKEAEKEQEKKVNKIKTNKSRILKSLKTLHKKNQFNAEEYEVLKNMSERISYILGISSGKFNRWVIQQKTNKPVQIVSEGIVNYVNEVIKLEGLSVEEITYSKARVSRAGKRKKLTTDTKSKLIKKQEKEKLDHGIKIINSNLIGEEDKIKLSPKQKSILNGLRYGSHKALYMLTNGDKSKFDNTISYLQSAKIEHSSRAIAEVINKEFKRLKIKKTITHKQIGKYLKNRKDKDENNTTISLNHLPQDLQWLA